jgi:hypothetical protein
MRELVQLGRDDERQEEDDRDAYGQRGMVDLQAALPYRSDVGLCGVRFAIE